MNILVVNDDGIESVGIKILATHLKKYGNVYVVAPNKVRSGSSHSIVLRESIYFAKRFMFEGIQSYEISGMPADCFRLAYSLLNIGFDIVFSGVNDGLNMGTDIFYSGTVAAAREASLYGIPSVAISTDFGCFKIVEDEIDMLLDYIFKNKMYSKDYVLNVNFPKKGYDKFLGYRVTKQGIKLYHTVFIEENDKEYRESHSVLELDQDLDTDVNLAKEGFITFVPLGLNETNVSKIKDLKKYEK